MSETRVKRIRKELDYNVHDKRTYYRDKKGTIFADDERQNYQDAKKKK